MAWYDYIPVVSNVAGAIKGDAVQAIGGPAGKLGEDVGILPNGKSSGGAVNGAFAETEDEKRQRQQAEQDTAAARSYRNRLTGEPDASPRAAPTVGQVDDPRHAYVARPDIISAPGAVSAGAPITTQTVGSTYDGAQSAESRAAEQAYIERARAVQAGTAGPSAAELQMRQGSAAATAAAYAMAAGHKGYSGAATREAQRLGAAAQQRTLMDTGILRAGEVAQARQEEGAAIQNMRGQDLSAAGTEADLSLRAAQTNQGASLTAAQANAGNTLEAGKANAGNQLEAAKANQAARLSSAIAQAGFNQQSLMKMSDAQLQTALANAGFQLSQEQIDDLRLHNQRQQQLEAQDQVLSAGQANSAQAVQIRQIRAQLAQAVAENDQKKQTALLGMLAQLGAKGATA